MHKQINQENHQRKRKKRKKQEQEHNKKHIKQSQNKEKQNKNKNKNNKTKQTIIIPKNNQATRSTRSTNHVTPRHVQTRYNLF